MLVGTEEDDEVPPEPTLFFSNAKPVPKEWISFTRNGLLILAVFQISIAGGILFGWSSLQPILAREGIFAEHCLAQNVTNPSVEQLREAAGCEEQREALGDVYSVAINVNCLVQIFVGFFLDKCGPKSTIVVSFLTTTTGIILLGFRQLWPAVICLAVGTPGIQNSLFHVANLFPFASGTATSMITAALSVGPVVFTVFSVLYQDGKGASLLSICMGYAFLTFMMAMTSAIVWPNKMFTQFVPRKLAQLSALGSHNPDTVDVPALVETLLAPESEMAINHGETANTAHDALQTNKPWITVSLPSATKKKGQLIRAENNNILSRQPLHKQLLAPRFILLAGFFAVQNMISNYYIETMSEQVQVIECQDGVDSCSPESLKVLEKSRLIFNTILVVGALVSPVFGLFIDRFGLPACGFLSCFLSLVYSLVSLFLLNTQLQIITFVFYALFQGALFPFVFEYLGKTFGFANFGRLVGIIFLIGGAVGFSMVPLIHLASPDKPYSTSCGTSSCWLSLGYRLPNTVQAILLLITGLSFPVMIMEKAASKIGLQLK